MFLLYIYLTCFASQVVKVALDVHTSEMAGDILVFLTGKLSSSPYVFTLSICVTLILRV